MGIYYDAGTATIYLHDDSNTTGGHAANQPHTFAEIALAAAAQFIDNGTNKPSYRSTVNVQLGDKAGGTIDATGTQAATTTLQDTLGGTVIFDNTRTLKNRATQTTSWVYTFGTKVGSGNQASGVTGTRFVFGAVTSLQGAHSWYGCTLQQTSGAMTLTPATDNTGDMVNCLLQSSSTGNAPINLGSSSNRWANLYNVDISHGSNTNQVSTQNNALSAERMTYGQAAGPAFLASNAANVAMKDLAMFGSPTQSDLRWTGVGAVSWSFYRPTWTGNAAKFSTSSLSNPGLGAATLEYRFCSIKVVNRTGSGVAGIPVYMTDAIGTVVINALTDSSGEVSFGSGIGANMVAVMDHYVINLTTTYAQRRRSPFTVKVNTSDLAGYNINYRSRRYQFNWPGDETVTTTAGQYEDLGDIVAIEDQSGAPSSWIERSATDLIP